MKRMFAMSAATLVGCLIAGSVSSLPRANKAGSSNWAQWRGPDSQGISNEKNLPTEWSETKNVLWKTAIPGLGFSSPIIWEKKVFLTTAIEGGPAPADHKPVKHMIGDKEFTQPDWTGSDKLDTFKVFCLDR